jgi:hypothetical protein
MAPDLENLIFLKIPIFTPFFCRILPRVEADWHGLSFNEACHKQLVLERIQVDKEIVPLKKEYRADLLDNLKKGNTDDIDPDILYKVPLNSISCVNH